MKMRDFPYGFGLALAVSLTCTPAFALHPASFWYAGAGLGQTEVEGFCDRGDLLKGGFATVGSCDDTDVGFKLFGGLRFHRNFAVELGYADLGDYQANGTVAGGAPATLELDGGVLTGQLVGLLPLGQRWNLLGKVGAFYNDADSSEPATVDVDVADSTFGWALTGGVEYWVTEGFAVRAEFDRYAEDVGLFGGGVLVKF